jgi:hypothetical protein
MKFGVTGITDNAPGAEVFAALEVVDVGAGVTVIVGPGMVTVMLAIAVLWMVIVSSVSVSEGVGVDVLACARVGVMVIVGPEIVTVTLSVYVSCMVTVPDSWVDVEVVVVEVACNVFSVGVKAEAEAGVDDEDEVEDEYELLVSCEVVDVSEEIDVVLCEVSDVLEEVDEVVDVGKIVCVVNADSPPPGTQTITDPVTVCNFPAEVTDPVGEDVASSDVVVGVSETDVLDSLELLLTPGRRPTTPAVKLASASDELEAVACTDEADEVLGYVGVGTSDEVEVVLAASEWTATGVLLVGEEEALVSGATVLSGSRGPTIPTGED